MNETPEYIQYAKDIIENKIVSGKLIKQACKRFLDWLNREDIYLDHNDILTKIRFIERLKHTKGRLSGQYFYLLPYQKWIVANIFGWKYKDTGERVINTALLMLARKSGKTFFATALMLAAIVTDKEKGAEGYMIANSTQQASIAFSHASNQCASIDPKSALFFRFRSQIRIPILDSYIQILSSDTSKLDGMSPSIFIVDEYHEAKSIETFSILRTGQGARKNPLGIITSTAGFNIGVNYPLYGEWVNAKQVLSGLKEQDTLFAAIYQLDDEDDWKDESCWIKANPTLGETVTYKYLREQVEQATNNPSYEVSVRTKNFNQFCQSEKTWIPNEKIKENMQKIDDSIFNMEEDYCIIGVDISERSDLCVVSYLVPKGDLLYLKAFPFICRNAYDNSPNKELYRQWVNKGYMTLVDTDSIDIDYVIKMVQDINENIPVALIAYDPWHAQQFKIACEKRGLPMHACKQGLGSFSEPTSLLEHYIYTKQVVIDENPCTLWCFANVLIKTDENENRKPVKSSDEQKIDIVIAFIQTVKLYMELTGIIDNTNLEAVRLD